MGCHKILDTPFCCLSIANNYQLQLIPMTSPPQSPPPPVRPPRLDSRQLLQGGKEIVITHGSEEYRLRLTAGGKLILTK